MLRSAVAHRRVNCGLLNYFFFSSRRRHTRSLRDWSSDVCSSDLRPHWRPITAIRAAADLGNPELKGDKNWEPLLVTPPHPEYPSAHAVFSGAAESVLRAFFGGDEVNVSVTFPAVFGVTRTYRSFSAITEEVDNARVWGGIHFRSADKDGSELGRKIGAIVMRDFPRSAPARIDAQLGT